MMQSPHARFSGSRKFLEHSHKTIESDVLNGGDRLMSVLYLIDTLSKSKARPT